MLNYIPSHIGIHGNEVADRLAKVRTTLLEVEVNIVPSLSQYKTVVKQVLKSQAKMEYSKLIGQSQSITWHNTASQ